MCGFIITNNEIELKNYQNLLSHRGPDQLGFYNLNFKKKWNTIIYNFTHTYQLEFLGKTDKN